MNDEQIPERLERPSSPFLDGVLGNPFPVLDHGFIRVVDYMGDEAAIAQAARVSYGKGTKSVSEDAGLLRYLMRHWHTTPFEMCEIKLHVKLPIFVARQWIRHRTANVNEMSARYSLLPGEFYVPQAENIQPQSKYNKQGRDGEYTEANILAILDQIEAVGDFAYGIYNGLSDEDEGYALARELSRMVLPSNIYTEWYWKVDLHNLLHFLRLRADSHAQFEIRQYAYEIANLVSGWVPNVWQAHLDYRVNAHTFSAQEMDLIAAMWTRANLSDDLAENELRRFGASKREVTAFLEAVRRGS